jgi:hypothetical protein
VSLYFFIKIRKLCHAGKVLDLITFFYDVAGGDGWRMCSGHYACFWKKEENNSFWIIIMIIFVYNVLCDAWFGRDQMGRPDGRTDRPLSLVLPYMNCDFKCTYLRGIVFSWMICKITFIWCRQLCSITSGNDNKCIIPTKLTVARSSEVKTFLIAHQWNNHI